MKVKISFEVDYEPSEIAQQVHDNIVDQWLSDYDMLWMVDEGWMSNAKAEVLETA